MEHLVQGFEGDRLHKAESRCCETECRPDVDIKNLLAVNACFKNTPHFSTARDAAMRAVILSVQAHIWFMHRHDSAAPAGGDGDDGFRAMLTHNLDWVHQYGTLDDGADDGAPDQTAWK